MCSWPCLCVLCHSTRIVYQQVLLSYPLLSLPTLWSGPFRAVASCVHFNYFFCFSDLFIIKVPYGCFSGFCFCWLTRYCLHMLWVNYHWTWLSTFNHIASYFVPFLFVHMCACAAAVIVHFLGVQFSYCNREFLSNFATSFIRIFRFLSFSIWVNNIILV